MKEEPGCALGHPAGQNAFVQPGVFPLFQAYGFVFRQIPSHGGNRSPATGWCLYNSFRAHSCPEKVSPDPVPVNPAVRHTWGLAHSFPPCSGGSARSGGRTPAGRSRGRKKSLFPEPLFGGLRPLIRGMPAFFHAIPVASRGIEIQADGNPLIPAGLFHQPAVGAGNAVIQSVDEEDRRRLFRYLPLRGTHLLQGRGGMGAQYFCCAFPRGLYGAPWK